MPNVSAPKDQELIKLDYTSTAPPPPPGRWWWARTTTITLIVFLSLLLLMVGVPVALILILKLFLPDID
jgi:hypothetical protein